MIIDLFRYHVHHVEPDRYLGRGECSSRCKCHRTTHVNADAITSVELSALRTATHIWMSSSFPTLRSASKRSDTSVASGKSRCSFQCKCYRATYANVDAITAQVSSVWRSRGGKVREGRVEDRMSHTQTCQGGGRATLGQI